MATMIIIAINPIFWKLNRSNTLNRWMERALNLAAADGCHLGTLHTAGHYLYQFNLLFEEVLDLHHKILFYFFVCIDLLLKFFLLLCDTVHYFFEGLLTCVR